MGEWRCLAATNRNTPEQERKADHIADADEQGATHALATTADEALAAPLPGLAGPGLEKALATLWSDMPVQRCPAA